MPALGAIANRSKSIRNLGEKSRKRKVQKPQDHYHDPSNDAFENNLSSEQIDFNYHHGKTRLGKFLQFIDPFIIALIVVNALMMGIATFDFVTEDERLSQTFEQIDGIFLKIFTAEVSLAIFHFLRLDRITFKAGIMVFPPQEDEERKERASNKSWLIFDALVVIMSWAFASVSIIRAFRILRALRLIAKIKSMRSVILALTRVLPKMVMVG